MPRWETKDEKKTSDFCTVIAAFALSADAKWRKHYTDKRITAIYFGINHWC
jgi:hypothetical protein